MVLKWLFFAFSAFSLIACGDGGGSSKPEIQEYVIKGDPDEFIKGAQLNQQSPFNADNIQTLSNYSMTSMIQFNQKSKPEKTTSKKDLEEKNAGKERSRQSFRLNVTDSGQNKFVISVESMPLKIVMTPDQSGQLQVTEIMSDTENVKVTTLHWSQTADKGMMSLLISYSDPEAGKGIAAIYFKTDGAHKDIPLYDKIYQYLAGAGVGVAWNTNEVVKLNICSPQVDSTLAQAGLNHWQVALENRLNVSLETATTYAPFSDLNQRCIYALDIYDNSPGNLNFGVTPSILDLDSGEIIDSDVIIFNAAFTAAEAQTKEKGYNATQAQQLLAKYKSITYTHELGHLLGLHHKFDGTPSIMSYDFDTMILTDYDVHAIQTLYPEKTTIAAKETKEKDSSF